jgi:hypothetical protein
LSKQGVKALLPVGIKRMAVLYLILLQTSRSLATKFKCCEYLRNVRHAERMAKDGASFEFEERL